MFNKKAVVISTCAGTGSKKAIEPIARMLFYWGVPVVYKYGKAIQAVAYDQIDPKKMLKIKKDMQKLANKISKNKQPKVGFKTKLIFNMMKMMQSKHMSSSEVERQYWQDQGWLGKKRPWKI